MLAAGLVLGAAGRGMVGRDREGDPGQEAAGRSDGKSGVVLSSSPSSGRAYASAGGLLEDREMGRLGRMSRWLLDADEAELAEVWEGLKYDNETSDAFRKLLMRRWMMLNPEAALAAIRRTQHKEWAWAEWGRIDAVRAFDAVEREARTGSVEAAQTALRGLATVNPRKVMDLLERYPNLKDMNVEKAVALGLARLNPREAMLYSEGDYMGRGEPLAMWAKKDPDAALAWYLKVGKGRSLTNDFMTLAKTLAQEHPGAIDRLAATLPAGGELRRALMAEHARLLARRDVEAALNLVRTEQDAEAQRELIGHVGAEVTYRDPQAGIALLREALAGSGAGREDGWANGTGNWFAAFATVVPQEAMELLDQDPNTHSDVRELMARKWREWDEVGFSEWLLDQPPSSQRDSYIGALANSLTNGADRDFESAVDWAAAMHGDGRRRFQLRSVIRNWLGAYPEEARVYLESGAAPASAREIFEERGGGS